MSSGYLTVTPSVAARAYGAVNAAGATGSAPSGADAASATDDFGTTLQDALQSVADAGHQADTASVSALSGKGDLTDVVTAVSRAQLALQTTTVIRDRVVQAYQDIMRMSI